MAAYDTVDPSLPDLPEFDRARGRCKNEVVDDVDAAVDHRKSTVADFKDNPTRHIGHTIPRTGMQLARSGGEPSGGQPLAAASCRKPATAIVGTSRKALLGIAHHHMA